MAFWLASRSFIFLRAEARVGELTVGIYQMGLSDHWGLDLVTHYDGGVDLMV